MKAEGGREMEGQALHVHRISKPITSFCMARLHGQPDQRRCRSWFGRKQARCRPGDDRCTLPQDRQRTHCAQPGYASPFACKDKRPQLNTMNQNMSRPVRTRDNLSEHGVMRTAHIACNALMLIIPCDWRQAP